MRTLPAICVHKCIVLQVSLHASNGSSGHCALLLIGLRPSRELGTNHRVAYAACRLGRRTALTLPLASPPQKNRSAPSDSSPDTPTPAGISSLSSTFPVFGSRRRKSLSSPSHVACHSSPSTQVTPVTKRLDSMVRRTFPVLGSI